VDVFASGVAWVGENYRVGLSSNKVPTRYVCPPACQIRNDLRRCSAQNYCWDPWDTAATRGGCADVDRVRVGDFLEGTAKRAAWLVSMHKGQHPE